MDENREVRPKEINLIDLIFYCLEKWRWFIVFMIILAILAGVYKYKATVNENKAKQEAALLLEEEDEGDDVNIVKVDMQSVTFYEQAIAENTAALERQKEYLETSAVMDMDSYHVATGILSYYLEGGENLDSLLAAYNAYISDGRLAEKLNEIDADISVADLRYLISFTNNFDTLYEVGGNQAIKALAPEHTVFQIKIRMPDDSLCKVYLKSANEAIAAYSAKLQTELGEHRLSMLASTQSEMMDTDIKSYQDNTRAAYLTAVKNLQTLRTELETLRSTAEIPEQPDETGAIVLANPKTAAVKYAIVGLVLGAFLVCFGLMLMYMADGKLRNTNNFNLDFGMPLLGMVRDFGKKKKLFGFIDNWVMHMKEGSYAAIGFDEQIKMAASNVQAAIARKSSDGELRKIMIAGSMAEKDAAALCERLSSELQGISLSSYRQIVYQSAALKDLENYDGVLFLEKKGTSNASMILQERKAAFDRNVTILGAIVLY